MNNLLKIPSFFLLMSYQSAFSQQIFAETLQQFEKSLIQKFDKTSCNSRYECDESNEEIAETIKSKLNEDTETFKYSFPLLVENGLLRIHFSPDRKIKFYTMDVSGGGTMREATTEIQFKQGSQFITQSKNDIGFISKVDQVQIENRSIYLVQSTYIGSTCLRMYGISALKLDRKQLSAAKIFQTKNKQLDSIEVENECKDIERQAADFIRVSKDLKNIDILVVKSTGELTNNYLRYQKASNGYRYIGIVK